MGIRTSSFAILEHAPQLTALFLFCGIQPANTQFGAWMIESTPAKPYSNYASDLLRVERNMITRRRRLLSVLGEHEIAPTVTNFPLLGTPDSIASQAPFDAPFSESVFLPDFVINPHPRFAALTQNIKARRGSKVDIRVPLFQDTATVPEADPSIQMDCMAFGMGMCCLQVTFQARDVDESRYMYDQLAVLAPIMLAMTAASPIFKGLLADIDARWSVIAQSVDDRTPAERGLVAPEVTTCHWSNVISDYVLLLSPLTHLLIQYNKQDLESAVRPELAGGGVRPIPKSRYDSISTYIYHCSKDPIHHRSFDMYNDISCPIDEDVKARLLGEGLDANLAHHLAHLFIRDPLVIFEGMIELNDEERTDHFENIQSTNWQVWSSTIDKLMHVIQKLNDVCRPLLGCCFDVSIPCAASRPDLPMEATASARAS
jgi:glutamate--cysteine ligase catalytic subunit